MRAGLIILEGHCLNVSHASARRLGRSVYENEPESMVGNRIHPLLRSQASLQRLPWFKDLRNEGTLMIRIGLWGMLSYNIIQASIIAYAL